MAETNSSPLILSDSERGIFWAAVTDGAGGAGGAHARPPTGVAASTASASVSLRRASKASPASASRVICSAQGSQTMKSSRPAGPRVMPRRYSAPARSRCPQRAQALIPRSLGSRRGAAALSACVRGRAGRILFKTVNLLPLLNRRPHVCRRCGRFCLGSQKLANFKNEAEFSTQKNFESARAAVVQHMPDRTMRRRARKHAADEQSECTRDCGGANWLRQGPRIQGAERCQCVKINAPSRHRPRRAPAAATDRLAPLEVHARSPASRASAASTAVRRNLG